MNKPDTHTGELTPVFPGSKMIKDNGPLHKAGIILFYVVVFAAFSAFSG